MITKDIIWYKNPTILYKKYYEIYPKINDSRVKQTNIITRVCIYIIIILLAINCTEPLFFPIGFAILINILYIIHSIDKNSKKKDIERILDNRKQKKKSKQDKYDEFTNFSNNFMEADNLEYNDENNEEDNYLKNKDFEVGYRDFSGDMNIGEYYDANKNKDSIEDNDLFTIDEKEKYNKETCRRPTFDNPFMNPSPNDYNNNKEEVPKACNVNDKEINDEMEHKFNENMFRNIDDVFDIENSKRQFYSLPSRQVPNDQKEFALWCWGTGPTCKEDQSKCLRYEDVRFKRRRVPHRVTKTS